MRKIILCICVFLFASTVLAAELDFEVIRVTLDERGDASVEHFVGFDSTVQKTLSMRVFGNTSLRVFDSQGDVEFTEENGLLTITPSASQKGYSLTVEYSTSTLTSKTGGEWKAVLGFEHSNQPVQDLKIELVLPQNVVVLDMEPKGILFSGDSGLEIEWVYPRATDKVQANVTYSLSGNGNPKGFDFALVGWVVLVLLAVGGVGYYFAVKKRKKVVPLAKDEKPAKSAPEPGLAVPQTGQTTNRQDGMLRLLSENERKIMDELMATNSMPQRTLQVKLGLPKSTLSRTIKKLEVKGLVKSLEIGNSKRVELGEELVKAGSE